MLVLSRKPGDKIDIGGNIMITVLEVNRARVRLGIEAPKEIKITMPRAGEQDADDQKAKPETTGADPEQ